MKGKFNLSSKWPFKETGTFNFSFELYTKEGEGIKKYKERIRIQDVFDWKDKREEWF